MRVPHRGLHAEAFVELVDKSWPDVIDEVVGDFGSDDFPRQVMIGYLTC